jgi:PAS domain S-box-containing protein
MNPEEDYEQFLISVDENLKEAIIRVSPAGTITWWGKGAEAMFGYTRDEALGNSIDIITPSRFTGEHARVLERVEKEGGLRHHMTMKKAKDGTEIPVKIDVGAIKKNGELTSLSMVVQDISEQKKAIRTVVEAEKKYLSLFESSKDIIFAMDSQGQFVSINRAFDQVMGFDRREFLGKPFLSLVVPWYMEPVKKALDDVLSGKDVSLELMLLNREVRPLTLSFSIFPDKDEEGNIVGAWGIGRDVTEKRKAEKKLKKYASELEKSNHLKDLFIDIMRHDLLNPVGTINNFTDFLLGKDLEPEAREYAGFIKRNTGRILELVENASKFSKLETLEEAGSKRIDVKDVLQDILRDLEPAAREKGVTFDSRIKDPLHIEASPFLEDVLSNLISNAIKYGDRDNEVTIGAEDLEDAVRFYIKDRGEGVPDEYKKSIFERFTRIKKEGVKGTGLGLAIVKKVVEDIHGGQVWVEDNPGGGSVFYVEIPKKG